MEDKIQNIDIYEIDKYIRNSYSVKTLINLSFDNNDQICFFNKKLDDPYCSFYFDICPKWGFAPNKLLIYYSKERKDHSGSDGAIIYKGIESIDWLMQNIFNLSKEIEQLTLF